jgi:hypothetical protein
MTKLQTLQKELRDINHQLKLSKHTIGYLGSQYPYWSGQKDKVKKKIEKLRNAKKLKK